MISKRIRGRAAPCKRRLRTALLTAALVAVAAHAGAGEFRLFAASPPGYRSFADVNWIVDPSFPHIDPERSSSLRFDTDPNSDSDLRVSSDTGDPQEPPPPPPQAAPQAPPQKLFTTGTTLVTAGALLAGALEGLNAPLKYGFQSFHFTDEGFFNYNTYAGGADKASHFTVSSGISRLLFDVYQLQGHTVDQSFNLALATTVLIGTFIEIEDAITVYGFSLQDLTADVLGTTAGLLIQRNHLQDLIGLRVGRVDTEIPARAIGSSEETLGVTYSDEIYLVDLKLGGLVSRLHGKPGIERFFLTSFAYLTKGYGYAPPLPTRYQEVGVELGLDFSAILKAAGLKETTWWARGIYAFFNFFRIPYTQVGLYYNLKDHKWYGPGAPYHYY